MRGTIDGMEASGLKKKFKDKRFASAIRREVVEECKNLGLELDEFFGISIEAIRNIKDKVDLK